MKTLVSALFGAGILVTVPSLASEADFLGVLEGQWAGGGSIRLKPEDEPVDVNCELSSASDAASVSMDGRCNALIIMSRRIGADLFVDGGSYSGSYVGSTHGTATLAGTRQGDTINLSVSWPESGREAAMSLSASESAMQIVTSEAHPETGEQVVTAELSFQRQ